MDTNKGCSLDESHSLVIEAADEDNNMQKITYIKSGYGKQNTDRPLGAVRLELALDEAGMTQTELANLINVNQPTISRIVDGKTKRSRYLPLIAKALNKNVNWLSGLEPNDKNNAAVNNNLLDIDGNLFVIVPRYKSPNVQDSEIIKEGITEPTPIIISKEFIPKNIDHTKLKYIFEAERGMNPVIKIESAVTFDTSTNKVTNGDIFVVEYGNTICSRILFNQPNGCILVHSQESDFPDYEINPNEGNFKILGRVIQVTNKT